MKTPCEPSIYNETKQKPNENRTSSPCPHALDDFLVNSVHGQVDERQAPAGIGAFFPNVEMLTVASVLMGLGNGDNHPFKALEHVWACFANAQLFRAKLEQLSVDQLAHMYANVSGVPHVAGFSSLLRNAASPQPMLRFDPGSNASDQVRDFFGIKTARRVFEILEEYCAVRRIEDEDSRCLYEMLLSKATRRSGNRKLYEFPQNLLEDIASMRSDRKREGGLRARGQLMPPPEAEKVTAEDVD